NSRFACHPSENWAEEIECALQLGSSANFSTQLFRSNIKERLRDSTRQERGRESRPARSFRRTSIRRHSCDDYRSQLGSSLLHRGERILIHVADHDAYG